MRMMAPSTRLTRSAITGVEHGGRSRQPVAPTHGQPGVNTKRYSSFSVNFSAGTLYLLSARGEVRIRTFALKTSEAWRCEFAPSALKR